MKAIRRISKRYYVRQILSCFLVCYMLFGIPVRMAQATPTNPQVVAGSAGINQNGNTTTVNMNSSKAVINWDSLDTMQSEVLQFIKASGSFAALNRVLQGGATHFDGSLLANRGHIIIVNPHGLIFGPTSVVHAQQLTASTLDIMNDDFMSGTYKFVLGDGMGSVENYGNISAEQVALIGQRVLNAGVISSPGGYVLMAAGDTVYLGQEGSDVVVEVSSVTVPENPTMEGIGDVINEGTIDASAGDVVLAAGDTYSRAIDGLDKMSVAVDSGIGRVGQFGEINVDGIDGDGGTINLAAADVVSIGPDSTMSANAGANGDGGDIVTYSP